MQQCKLFIKLITCLFIKLVCYWRNRQLIKGTGQDLMSIGSNLIRWTVITIKFSNMILCMIIKVSENFDTNFNVIERLCHSSNSKISPTVIGPPPIP